MSPKKSVSKAVEPNTLPVPVATASQLLKVDSSTTSESIAPAPVSSAAASSSAAAAPAAEPVDDVDADPIDDDDEDEDDDISEESFQPDGLDALSSVRAPKTMNAFKLARVKTQAVVVMPKLPSKVDAGALEVFRRSTIQSTVSSVADAKFGEKYFVMVFSERESDRSAAESRGYAFYLMKGERLTERDAIVIERKVDRALERAGYENNRLLQTALFDKSLANRALAWKRIRFFVNRLNFDVDASFGDQYMTGVRLARSVVDGLDMMFQVDFAEMQKRRNERNANNVRPSSQERSQSRGRTPPRS
jgi:hypothetical protein